MRVEVPASVKEEVAIIDVSDDGTQISFNPETGFAQMPGGAKNVLLSGMMKLRRDIGLCLIMSEMSFYYGSW